MIEALIDPDTGDVIVVKPLGSVWGRCEVNAVVKLDDPELEKALAGQEHIAHPYAVQEITTRTIVNQQTGRTLQIRKRQQVVSSLVKIDVATARASKTISARQGTLRAKDADTLRVQAAIADVAVAPAPSKPGAIVKSPERKLPAKTIVVR